jgi:UDPglucose--hexose-1-phosphate uridylyltransferase
MDVRVDALSGDTVVITGGRQGRPNLPPGCPFCPGGLEAPDQYDVRWFVNRWPALPDGRAEVLLFSPEHGASLASLGVTKVREVVDLWAERTAAQGARDDVGYVLLFENRGRAVGATVDHPHGQLYAFGNVPAAAAVELQGQGCALCLPAPEDLVVAAHHGWCAVVPHAARWPFELLIEPIAHVADLPSLDHAGRDAMAAVLVDALTRLDQLFDEAMPYMLWIHQRPSDGQPWPNAHLHVHVAPLNRAPGTARYVAAGELGSGVWFNPVVPEDAARLLRDVPGAVQP